MLQPVYGDVTNAEIEGYRASHPRQKYMCTYDSLGRLVNLLGEEWMRFKVVVDEFHVILNDCSFKAYTEWTMLRLLQPHPHVTYVSATPQLDSILERMPEFRDLEYHQLEWEDQEPVYIERLQCSRPVDGAMRIVREYMNGEFPYCVMDGEKVYADEAIIFLNSVENIINIIHQTCLSPEMVNIIVADNDRNHEAIAQLGPDFQLGSIPLKGEPRKRITLCTSTCYFGIDFYSDRAQVYVVSDCHRQNTSVDISTELPQIVGRIRNVDNPFRHQVYFIYNTWQGNGDINDRLQAIREKHERSQQEVQYFNSAPPTIRHHLIKMIGREMRCNVATDSFTYYDDAQNQFCINHMSLLSEEYEARVQYATYHDHLTLFRELTDSKQLATDLSVVLFTVTEHISNILTKTTFAQEMEQYCNYRQQQGYFHFLTEDYDRQNPKLRLYYDRLGPERIHALGYKEKLIINELNLQKQDYHIRLRLQEAFPVGTELTAD